MRKRLAWGTVGAVLIASQVCAATLLLGAVHTPVVLGLAVSASIGLLLLRRQVAITPAVALLAALAVTSLLQSTPIPPALAAILDADLARTWEQAQRLLGVSGWHPLALEPASARLEALKLLIYASTWACAHSYARRHGTRPAANLVFWLCLSVAVLTIGHRIVGASAVYGVYKTQWGVQPAPLINPNNLSGLLNLGAFCGLGMALSRRVNSAARLSYGIGVACLAATSVLTGSRAGSVTLLLGLVTVGLLVVRRLPDAQSRLQLGALVGGTLILGASFATSALSHSTLAELTTSSTVKLQLFGWALELIQHHPWVGVGPGGFSAEVSRFSGNAFHTVFPSAENWPLSWAAAWGIVVGGVAALALAAALDPRRLLRRSDNSRLTLYAGGVVLTIQNLFDLGFEVPGVVLPLIVMLASLWATRKHQGGERKWVRAPWASYGLAALIAGAAVLVSVLPKELPHDCRKRLSQDLKSPRFFQQLSDALLQHPGDAHLLRLGGAALAASGRPDSIRWINASLRRDPKGGRSYLLLAGVLQRRGATDQALVTLREAIVSEPQLTRKAVRLALRWAPGDASRIVPRGESGAPVLLELARVSKSVPKRIDYSLEAARRAPEQADGLLLAVEVLARAVHDDSAHCAARKQQCLNEAAQHLEVASRLTSTERLATARGWLYLAQGRAQEAFSELLAHCPRTSAGASCLSLLLRVGATLSVEQHERASHAFLDAQCVDNRRCAHAEFQVGQSYQSRGAHTLAFEAYRNHAKRIPSAQNWLGVARAAQRAKLSSEALKAVTQAERLCEHGACGQKPAIDAERERILRGTLRK